MSVLHEIKTRIFGHEQPLPMSSPTSKPTRKVVMYATRFCPFCMRARTLLSEKHVAFKEIAVDGNPGLRAEMTEKSRRYTVPQIWIGDQHIGGCEELMALERSGALDQMLFEDAGEKSDE